MRNFPILLLISSLIAWSACNDQSKTTSQNKSTATPATAQVAPPSLPSITLEEMKILFEKCDYIDFIFYNMDFSMSVNDKNNVQRVVTFVDKAQPPGNLTCPTMGRIDFQGNGELLMMADMHYDKECYHLVFYKDGKKAYTNRLTEQGRTYFQQMFAQVRVRPNQPGAN